MTIKKPCLAVAALALAAAMPVAAGASTHHFWLAFISFDRMTDEEKVLGVYALTSPEEPRPSVYADIHGMLMIHCAEGVNAFFYLVDSEGYPVQFLPHGTEDWIEIRVRFDNETVQELTAYTLVGERTSLVFVSEPYMLSLAEGRSRVLIEVPSVEGSLYFDFILTGLHEAHRKTCG